MALIQKHALFIRFYVPEAGTRHDARMGILWDDRASGLFLLALFWTWWREKSCFLVGAVHRGVWL